MFINHAQSLANPRLPASFGKARRVAGDPIESNLNNTARRRDFGTLPTPLTKQGIPLRVSASRN
jgi:hypothetical protein